MYNVYSGICFTLYHARVKPVNITCYIIILYEWFFSFLINIILIIVSLLYIETISI